MAKRQIDDDAAWEPRHHGVHSSHVHGASQPGPVRVSSHPAGDAAEGTSWGPELERLHYGGFFGEGHLSHGHGPVYDGPAGSWSTPGALPGGYRASKRPPLDDASRRRPGETPSGYKDWGSEEAEEAGAAGETDADDTRGG